MIVILIVASFIQLFNSEEMIMIETTGRGTFKSAVEEGLTFSGVTNFTFSLKTCADGVIVFSDTMVVANKKGNYILVMFGADENTHITITDSCFQCNRKKSIAARIMKCDEFLDFWSKFDGKGNFEIGRGKEIGENSLMDFKATHSDVYNVYSISFTSTNENKATWKIPKEEFEPMLYQPITGGHTIVEMTDADAIGSDVIDIIVTHERHPEKFSLMKNTSNLFALEGSTVVLAERLSLTHPFHVIRLRSDGGFATAFTVVVKPFIPLTNNSRPVLNVDNVIRIPEDTPVGSVVDWNLIVSDVDQHDTIKLKTTGVLGAYFRVTRNDKLTLLRALDREAFDHQPFFILTATDMARNVVGAKITVNVTDLNDNTPECEKDVFILHVEEMPEQDKEILILPCTDEDEGPNGGLQLSLVEDQGVQSIFYIRNTSLFVKSGTLDYETSHVTTVLVNVRDSPTNDLPNTITVIVIVKILPKDESTPIWLSPNMVTPEKFLDVSLLIGSPPGSLVTSFTAKDDDDGEGDITYSLGGKRTGFEVNEKTGHMTLLDGVGGDAFIFELHIYAKSGERQIHGVLMVHFVHSVESSFQPVTRPAIPNNEPHFNKEVYVIDIPKPSDWRRSLLNFQLVNHTPGDRSSVTIPDEGGKYFRLRFSLSSWKLLLKRKANVEAIPSSIVLTASFLKGNISARVLIRSYAAVCDVPVTTSNTHKEATIRQPGQVPTTTFHRKRKQRSGCTIVDDSGEQILVTLIVGESLGLVAMFLLRNTFKTRRRTKRRNIGKKPKLKKVKRAKRQEPVGCEKEDVRRESLRKTSISSKEMKVIQKPKTEGPVTLTEIEDNGYTYGNVMDKQGTGITETPMIQNVDARTNATSGTKVKDEADSIRRPPELSDALELNEIEKGQDNIGQNIPGSDGSDGSEGRRINSGPDEQIDGAFVDDGGDANSSAMTKSVREEGEKLSKNLCKDSDTDKIDSVVEDILSEV